MTNSEKVLAAIAGRYGTQDPAKLQIQRWTYYDYVRLPVAGTNRLTFMSNPIGSVDPVSGAAKTLEETNIRRSGELDNPFVIMAIKTVMEILPVNGRQAAAVAAVTTAVNGSLTPVHRALRNMANLGVLSVLFGQKGYVDIEQPFQMCPPGYGPSIRSIAGLNGTPYAESLYYSQSVDPRDNYVVSPPVFVEKGQTLEATIDFLLTNSPAIPQVAGENVNVNVGLEFDGYVVRPVQ